MTLVIDIAAASAKGRLALELRGTLADQVERELAPYLEPTAAAVVRHMLMRYDTEINWHTMLLDEVGSFGAPRPADPRASAH